MCDYSYYITPEQYLIAAKNGISKATLEERIRRYGWCMNKAITTPVRKTDRSNSYFAKVAKENGIKTSTFYMRLKVGMTAEEAAITPPMNNCEILDMMHQNNIKYSNEIKKLCEENGICKSTFTNRVNKLKWDIFKAATIPPQKKGHSKPTKVNE